MNSLRIKDKQIVYDTSIAFAVKEMRILVVLCAIAALAAPSLGESEAAPENAQETKEAKVQEPEAVNPAIEPESTNNNVEAPKNPPTIAEPQVDPTPAPGERPTVVEIPDPETKPFYSTIIHAIMDRLFQLPDFHWPSLNPFRRRYPLYPPPARYPYILRESEPDYY